MLISYKWLRIAIACYFVVIVLGLLQPVRHAALSANGWSIGDWLINYEGGFVRRGLVGEILLYTSKVIPLSLSTLAASLQLIIYAIFLGLSYILMRTLHMDIWLVAVIFSPATFIFPLLDPQEGLRKEIVLYLCMVVLILYLRGRVRNKWLTILFLMIAVCGLALTHEALILYVPYLFGIVFLNEEPQTALIECLPAAVIAIPLMLLIKSHPGDMKTAAAICASVGGGSIDNGGVCGRAISYLSRDLDYARRALTTTIKTYGYWSLYGVRATLAFIPIVGELYLLMRDEEIKGRLRIIVVALSLSILASVPLFFIANDWGRWLSMHCICILLLLLMGRPSETGEKFPAFTLTPLTGLLLLAYCTLWTLPGAGRFEGRGGYIWLAKTIIHKGNHSGG